VSDSGTIDLVAGKVTGISSGVDLKLTVSFLGCDDNIITVPAAECPECEKPILTAGELSCDASTSSYSVEFTVSDGTITSSEGAVSGNKIINIPLGSDVVITATSGVSCSSSITITGLSECPTECKLPDLIVGQAICDGVGSGTYTVSYTENTGADILVTDGTDNNNGTISGTIGTDIIISASNGRDCTSTMSIESPADCLDPCASPLISIGGASCTTDGSATYEVSFSLVPGASLVSDSGTINLGSGKVTGIASGVDVILTASFLGCDDDVITVPAAVCPECEKPILTAGEISCDATNSTYSVVFTVSDGTITSSAGTVS
jgi:hypothetical protein